ncbi:LACTB2 [Blepharisma stoltei]|uniref:Metallo-beta-lactamase domain-containing protein n=1 Tax=Blepharisma stoltei TaxID=1481888 RepID=A0AAU9JDI8_9CILI|nr:unnamed protein product [Blepharisma stoltei]
MSRLSSLVSLYPGFNPSIFTLEGTNTYIIGTGQKKILIDTGEGIPAWIENLSRNIARNELQCILITHSHPDHIGGINDAFNYFGRVPVYKRVMDNEEDREINEKFQNQIYSLSDNEIIRTEGVTLQAVFTPGHKNDHVCYFLQEENAVFTGDLIMGRGSTILDVYYDYMNSLYRVQNIAPRILYTGHGETNIFAAEKITENIEHRNQRERQVFNALDSQKTTEEIVATVYGQLDEKVRSSAIFNTNQYLQALKIKNLVEYSESELKWKRAE